MAEVPYIPPLRRRRYFEGILYPNVVTDSAIQGFRSFTVRSEDIWLVAYPRSGIHWLNEIVGLILTGGRPDEVDRSLRAGTAEMIDMKQTLPRTKEEEQRLQPDMAPFFETIDRAPSPRVAFSHLRLDRMPEHMLKITKVIYIARNPKDAAASWFKFMGKSPFHPRTWEQSLHEFMHDKQMYGSWFEHVHEFWKIRDEPNLLFLFYEDILKDPAKYIKQIADHINRPLSDDVLQRVLELSSVDGMKATFDKLEAKGESHHVKGGGLFTFLNKGICGNWKNYFTVAQNEAFDEWYKKEIEGTDLSFSFV